MNNQSNLIVTKMRINDLSTWGLAEKQIIYKNYLLIAKNFYDNQFSTHTWKQFFMLYNAMESSFKIINPKIWFLDPTGEHNVIANYLDHPQPQDDVKALLHKGLKVVVSATALPIVEKITLNIKGSI